VNTDDMSQRETARAISRGELMRRGILSAVGLAGLSSLSGMVALDDVENAFARFLEQNGHDLKHLIDAAKKEGNVNVIALPRDWSNYGEIMDRFQAKYHIGLTDAAPDDSSAQEMQAITQLKGQDRAPDVVDVSPTFAELGKKQKLFSPYKVSTWRTIPSNMKDPQGYWTGDYYGVQSFGTNLSIQKTPPKDWSDLKNPRYRGQVAINGDPRSAGNAFSAVFAAALANGGSLNNIEPGINFFAELKKIGNFITANALPANIAKGATPVAIRWDYLNLGDKITFKGNPPLAVTVPNTGVYGGFYCQAISVSNPHPNAARLWLEFLYSDEGQLLWLKGLAHPARYVDLVKRKKVHKALAKQLPAAKHYKNVKFASLKQTAAATAVIQEQWGPKVAGS